MLEPSANLAKKISYTSSNHSAVSSVIDPNVFISKWGDGPLMKHEKSDCPYSTRTLAYFKKYDVPKYYIGVDTQDYGSSSSTVYATGGHAEKVLYAYYNRYAQVPTSYEWSATFSGSYDRWYIYPSGSRVEISAYLNSMNSGGMMRITCKVYSGSTLLDAPTYSLFIMPSMSYGMAAGDGEVTAEAEQPAVFVASEN